MLRLACSVALRIASGTSRALPVPKPARPLPSPTTTTAAKPKRRPPFTTLATRLMLTSFSTRSLSSRSPSRRRPPRSRPSFRAIVVTPILRSETQPAFAGGVGKRLDAAMEHEPAAVEHDFLDACLDRALGDQAPDFLCGADIGAGLDLALDILVEGRGGGQRHALRVVDDLRIDMLGRAEDRQPGTSAGLAAEAEAKAPLAAREQLLGFWHGGPLLLAFLSADVFPVVLDALALVGLGLAKRADFRRHLSDLLLIRAGDGDRRLLLADLDRVAFGDRELDVVAEARLQIEVLALELSAIADAVDLEVAGEAGRHTTDPGRDQCPAGAPEGARPLRRLARRQPHRALGDGDRHVGRDVERGLAELAGDGHDLTGDGQIDAARDRHRVFTNTRRGC